MTDPNVPPDTWAAIAAELRRIADDAEKLIGHPAPGLFSMNIQPWTPDPINRAQLKHRVTTVDAVDAVAVALLGREAKTYPLSGGNFHHGADGDRGPIEVRVYQAVADPNAVDKDEELARLRAEVEQLRAQQSGLDYSREADDPTSVSGGRVEPHVGAMTDAGLVDETDPPVQHSHAGGSFGGPGENSAECACGVTYDGFDTPAEANLRLAMHIDSANSPES